MIAALGARNRGIGKEGALLWHLPEDLRRFKALTWGHPMIMGRKTYESIGRPLPGRTSIVVSRNQELRLPAGVLRASTVSEALEQAKKIDAAELFVIGGGELYAQLLPFTERLYLTLVDADEPADAFFPEYANHFTVVEMKKGGGIPVFEWLTLDRNLPTPP